jgi:hypothetical protein
MDSFEARYWSRLQAELWVCTRSMEAVALAEHDPGDTVLADLSLGSDGLDDEALDVDRPAFVDESELIGTAVIRYGSVCSFHDARRELIVALSKGQLQEHQDRSSGAEFFEREEVLRLWPDPRWEILRAEAEPLTLAAAVALLIRGHPASKDAWARLRRRAGGRFPPAAEQRIKAAGKEILKMIRDGIVEAFGFRCDGDGGIGGLNPSATDKERLNDDKAFLVHKLWIAPWADAIWTVPDLGDGHFNPTDRSYRYVSLDRTQFLDAIRNHDTKAVHSTDSQRIRPIGGTPKRSLGRAAVVRRPEGSVARGTKAEVASEPLNTADGAQAPARNHGLERRKATIPPAPKRGPGPRYDWLAFYDALDELVGETPGLDHADAVRAMSDWCAVNWGGEDGQGEPANSTLRKHIAVAMVHVGRNAKAKLARKHLSRRAKTSARTSA